MIDGLPKPDWQSECGTAALYCGDCLELLPLMPDGSVAAVVTDPPYGIGEARNKNASRRKLAIAKDYGVSDWDDQPASPQAIAEVRRVSDTQVIFGGNYFDLPPTSCWLVWDKCNVDVAVKRIDAELRQGKLFAEPERLKAEQMELIG